MFLPLNWSRNYIHMEIIPSLDSYLHFLPFIPLLVSGFPAPCQVAPTQAPRPQVGRSLGHLAYCKFFLSFKLTVKGNTKRWYYYYSGTLFFKQGALWRCTFPWLCSAVPLPRRRALPPRLSQNRPESAIPISAVRDCFQNTLPSACIPARNNSKTEGPSDTSPWSPPWPEAAALQTARPTAAVCEADLPVALRFPYLFTNPFIGSWPRSLEGREFSCRRSRCPDQLEARPPAVVLHLTPH